MKVKFPEGEPSGNFIVARAGGGGIYSPIPISFDPNDPADCGTLRKVAICGGYVLQ